MRLYLITITCLGRVIREVRQADSSCAAIVDAMCRYPQHCSVGARRLAP